MSSSKTPVAPEVMFQQTMYGILIITPVSQPNRLYTEKDGHVLLRTEKEVGQVHDIIDRLKLNGIGCNFATVKVVCQ